MTKERIEEIKKECYEIWDTLEDKKNIVEVLIISQIENENLKEEIITLKNAAYLN